MPRVRVAVLMGGRSSEHEISVASAESVIDALEGEGYEVVTVEIDREGQWALSPSNRLSLGLRYNPPPWPATDFVSR